MTYQTRIVNGIIRELSKPTNQDLLFAVIQHLGAEDSFMFTFGHTEKVDFDTFVLLMPQMDSIIKALDPSVDEDLRSTSQRYDEYLALVDPSALNKSQTDRFEAILEPFDDGWSGSLYGFIMRDVQAHLLRAIRN